MQSQLAKVSHDQEVGRKSSQARALHLGLTIAAAALVKDGEQMEK